MKGKLASFLVFKNIDMTREQCDNTGFTDQEDTKLLIMKSAQSGIVRVCLDFDV